MLEAVLFDMDGVIVDSEPAHERVCMRLFECYGLNISIEEYREFTGSTNSHMWKTLKDKYSLEDKLEDLTTKHEKEVYRDFLEGDEKAVPGIPELLKELRETRIKTAVASSSPKYGIEHVIGKFNLKEYFNAVVSGEELNRPKPAPDIFLKAAEILGVKPENCVVIEDSHNGVRAAKAAGMKCIGFNNGGSGTQDISMADVIVESLEKVNVDFIIKLFNK